MRRFDTIILHCSATYPDWMKGQGVKAKRDEIDQWHKDRGWSGIGYHYVIDRDGSVITGRHLNKTGAHVKDHNTNSVGVCLIGGRWPDGRWALATDKFSDHFTPEQDKAARDLIADLKSRYPAIQHVTGHNDYTNAKGCPGFKVASWMSARETPKTPNTVSTRPQTQKPVQRPAQRPTGIAAILSRIFAFLSKGGPA
jgi:N-acetylmuramoyl-L-alanine amidase